jgi:cleavage and polyadenylation specificity factor subunit 2
MQNVPEEVPSKYVSSTAEVQLACRLLFVDLEGLNDGRAIKTIIPKVAPRKLVRSVNHVEVTPAY